MLVAILLIIIVIIVCFILSYKHTGAVAKFRYGTGIINWKASELKDLDRKSRKNDNVRRVTPEEQRNKLYVKRKEWGRGLINVEQCIKEEEKSLRSYVANSEENLIREVLTAETINKRETITSVEFKKQKAKELKEKLSGKQIHG